MPSLRGHGFVMQLDEEPLESRGFYVNRYVEADDHIAAVGLAVESVRSDQRMANQLGVRFEVDAVEPITEEPETNVQPGFIFYELDDDAN